VPLEENMLKEPAGILLDHFLFAVELKDLLELLGKFRPPILAERVATKRFIRQFLQIETWPR
jgi:hypothetical protein